jgi:uncharacterized delta-60 repeat protein
MTIPRCALPILFVSGLMSVRSASAAAGSLDGTFGTGGLAATTLTVAGGNNSVIPYSIKLQGDGKIVVLVNVTNGTSFTSNVLRYTASGQLDTTFGANGIATLPTTFNTFETMALASNGQIVVAGGATDPANGAAAFGVQRLNANGTADVSFGNGGQAIASLGFPGIESVLLIQPNGDILLGGQLEPVGRGQPFHTALARFTPAGALDPTFGNGGTVNVTAVGGCTAMALLSSGEIQVVNGQAIAQFTPNGALEPSASGGTIVTSAGSESPSAPSIFQPNDDYLFARPLFVGLESRGHNSSVQVLRFTPTGSPDSTFADTSFHFLGSGGSGIQAVPDAVALQSNGDIVVVGGQTTFSQSGTTTINGLARLTPGGNLDTTFGNGGTVTNNLPSSSGAVVQPGDGKIVTIGSNSTQLVVARYLGQ